jgi:acyl CoA:acetate/3-ketoacid CoA transferase beta subunit
VRVNRLTDALLSPAMIAIRVAKFLRFKTHCAISINLAIIFARVLTSFVSTLEETLTHKSYMVLQIQQATELNRFVITKICRALTAESDFVQA